MEATSDARKPQALGSGRSALGAFGPGPLEPGAGGPEPDETRAAIADFVVFGVAALAVFYVLRTPSLRRATWRLLKYTLFTAAPAYLWHETTRAWEQTSHS